MDGANAAPSPPTRLPVLRPLLTALGLGFVSLTVQAAPLAPVAEAKAAQIADAFGKEQDACFALAIPAEAKSGPAAFSAAIDALPAGGGACLDEVRVRHRAFRDAETVRKYGDDPELMQAIAERQARTDAVMAKAEAKAIVAKAEAEIAAAKAR